MVEDERAYRAAPRLILLTPIAPAPTGNGLAMRTELFRRAAAREFDVDTVVIPIAGRLPDGAASLADATVVSSDRARIRAAAAELLSDAVWRDRLALAETLPARARFASAGLADAVTDAIGAGTPVALHVMRSYLAPLGVAVSERLRASWTTLDLDEDDAAFAAVLGDAAEAAAHDRLLITFGPLFDGLSAASAAEARTISVRNRLMVEHVPNAVDVPLARTRSVRPGRISVLFVGNLTYQPNHEAAVTLVDQVLPELRRRLTQPVHVTLVGAHHAGLERLANDDVGLAGFVTDLGPVYAGADVTVVPLDTGAGTRIKLLEAFAHQVPVVASRTAAAGLGVTHGRHLLLADGAAETAAAAARITADPTLSARLVRNAYELVRDKYSTEVVIPTIAAFFARAARRAERRAQTAGGP